MLFGTRKEESFFFSFFGRAGSLIVDFLPLTAKSGEPIYFNIFPYHPEKFDSFFQGRWKSGMSGKDRLGLAIRKDNISSNSANLLSVLWKEGISAVNYTAIVRVG